MQFKLDRCSTGFFCPVSINSSDIVLQFDTGAVNTVISASALGYDEYEVERLQYYARTSSKCSKMFKSASGNDIFAYLCYSENVCIDDKVFSKFYYFLCLDFLKDSKGNPYHILLLGLDFITCCGLTCSIGGSFYVKSFSDSKY